MPRFGAVWHDVAANLPLCWLVDIANKDRDSTSWAWRRPDGAVFVDRDPDTFKILLNHCRDEDYPLPTTAGDRRRLQAEAAFFGMESLVKLLDGGTGGRDIANTSSSSSAAGVPAAGSVGELLGSKFRSSIRLSLGRSCNELVQHIEEALNEVAESAEPNMLLWLRTCAESSLNGLSGAAATRGYDLRRQEMRVHENFAPLLKGGGLVLLCDVLHKHGLAFEQTAAVRLMDTRTNTGLPFDTYEEVPMLKFHIATRSGVLAQRAQDGRVAEVVHLLRSVIGSDSVFGVPHHALHTKPRAPG